MWSRGYSGHFRSSKANAQKVAVGDRIGDVNNSRAKRGDGTQLRDTAAVTPIWSAKKQVVGVV